MIDGLFITFEGIEGSGKTTQLRILADHLAMQNRDVLATREPGGTRLGDAIRKLLLNPDHAEMAALTELLLYAAARAQHVAERIRPSLEKGTIVLCDRFTDATLAYQGRARKLPAPLIAQLNEVAAHGLRPHLTFLLDCPVEVGLSRARERFQAKEGRAGGDRLEREALAFHEEVRQAYLDLAHADPQRIRILDGTMDVDSLHQEVLRQMEPFL